MAIYSTRRNGDAIAEINTTPLIDVMLVLLTLLIITLPIQTHAIRLDLPHGVPIGPPPPVVTVAIDFQDTILWNGKPVDRATLDAYLANAARETPQPEIHVKPDRLTRYDIVAKVLGDAQRLGVARIGIVGNEQFAP
jgi:biopolymer transport protein ExbD